MSIKTVFFDAGNTLVFGDSERILAPLAARGVSPTQEQLYAAERVAKRRLDEARAHHTSVDAQFWDIYYSHLLAELDINDPSLTASLVALTRTSGNWRRLQPGTRDALQRLRQRFRLGIISNSDGHIRELFEAVALADCFDSLTDSALVGHEKPDARIFQAALQSQGAAAEESVYIGDIYSVDYVGARSAGLHAALMDLSGTYRGDGLPRLESLAEVEAMLLESET